MNEPNKRFIGISEVESRTSLSRPTIYRHVRAGIFPAQISISPGRVAWLEAEISDWIAARISAANKN